VVLLGRVSWPLQEALGKLSDFPDEVVESDEKLLAVWRFSASLRIFWQSFMKLKRFSKDRKEDVQGPFEDVDRRGGSRRL